VRRSTTSTEHKQGTLRGRLAGDQPFPSGTQYADVVVAFHRDACPESLAACGESKHRDRIVSGDDAHRLEDWRFPIAVRYHLYPDRYIDVKGVRTRYWEAGSGAQTVVLVHGLAGAVEVWAATIPALSRTRRVIALDLIGFGRTEKPDGAYDYPFFASFLNDFFSAMRIARAAVIGHSLGGGTALQFAVSENSKVERLVLVGSGGLSLSLGAMLRILTLPAVGEILTRPRRRTPRQFMVGQVHDPSIGDQVPVVVERFNDMAFLPGAPEAVLKTLRNNVTLFRGKPKSISGILPFLGAVRQKTLVVWGRQDRIIPFKVSRVALERLPNAELFALEDCGHCPMIEHQEVFNRRVREFLAAK
jgi:pimeloyl-ACP methyl ester carboxylesterase